MNTVIGTIQTWSKNGSGTVRVDGRKAALVVNLAGRRGFEIQENGTIEFSSNRMLTTSLLTRGQKIVILEESIRQKCVIWGLEEDLKKAEEDLLQLPVYRLVSSVFNWEGRDLADPQLTRNYNPCTSHPRNRKATWYVSEDNGETWNETKCPAQFIRQFSREGKLKTTR